MSTVKKILDSKGNEVLTIEPNTNVLDALKLMDKKGFGALLVVENEELQGIFTEGDYISRVLLKELDKNNTAVDAVMTKDVQTIAPQQTVNDSMQLMLDKDIRYFPVIEAGKLLGVISAGDCLKEVIAQQEQLIDQLEQYIHS